MAVLQGEQARQAYARASHQREPAYPLLRDVPVHEDAVPEGGSGKAGPIAVLVRGSGFDAASLGARPAPADTPPRGADARQ